MQHEIRNGELIRDAPRSIGNPVSRRQACIDPKHGVRAADIAFLEFPSGFVAENMFCIIGGKQPVAAGLHDQHQDNRR